VAVIWGKRTTSCRRSGAIESAPVIRRSRRAPQGVSADLERVADVVKAERHCAAACHHPARRLREEKSFAHSERGAAVAQDVDRVGEHCQHQSLFASGAALGNDLKELARENQTGAIEESDRSARSLCRHMAN
jgi:hypothetical protein